MIKTLLKIVLAAFMIFVGVQHFRAPEPFVKIVPSYLPKALLLVYISGFFEVLGGIGLLIPILTPYAAWGLIALYVAVFPANLNMAIDPALHGGAPACLLWLRLPLQLILILWAWWFT